MFEFNKHKYKTIVTLSKSGISPPVDYILNCSDAEYEAFCIAYNRFGGE